MSAENKRTILLVEDEVVIAIGEKITLENFGYNVITVNSGEEAVATIKKTPGIDLILMDINLGTGIDGTETAAIILRERDIPVVFLSSYTEPEIVEKTEKITSYGYVVKASQSTVLDASIKMAFKLFEAKIKAKEKESQSEDALKALRESETRYRELFDNISSGVAIYEVKNSGKDFIFKDLNRAGERLDKTRKEDVIGKNIYQARPGIANFGLLEVFKRVLATGVSEHYPITFYQDEKLQGWYDNFVYRLPSGEIVAVYDNISERMQTEVEIKRQLAEKEILLKEVHHRIKNNIASIGALISLHMQSIANPEAVAVLQEAIGRVNSMDILYDKLLLSERYQDISVKNYIESLIDAVCALFPDNAKIELDKQIADFYLDAKLLFPLGIIINELITNTIKYAFINEDAGSIKISLTKKDKQVTLTIQDNGNGLPAGFDIKESKGFGLKLVKMLSQQLGGSFVIENHAGTRCIIEFNI